MRQVNTNLLTVRYPILLMPQVQVHGIGHKGLMTNLKISRGHNGSLPIFDDKLQPNESIEITELFAKQF